MTLVVVMGAFKRKIQLKSFPTLVKVILSKSYGASYTGA